MPENHLQDLKFLTQAREPLLGLETPLEKADYISFGVPYDLTSSFRPGSRYGPEYVRRFSANIECNSYFRDFDATQALIYDAGNIAFDYRLPTMLKRVYRLSRIIDSMGKIPIMIGGEHTFTLPAVQALKRHSPSLVILDAHLDLRDEYCGLRLNHATYLRRLREKRPDIPMLVVGARGYDRSEAGYAEKNGITVISSRECENTAKIHETIGGFVEGRDVYVSVDMDVLDPGYAPGVGNPESGGLTTNQLLEIIQMMEGARIIGFDLMEVSPLYDNGATAAAAGRILVELLAVISGTRYL
jgi:agmatinase